MGLDLIEKAIEYGIRLIKEGSRRLDENQQFIMAYENACTRYKKMCGTDHLFEEFYKNGSDYMGYIKAIVDSSNFSCELETELYEYIKDEIQDASDNNITLFIEFLFIELLFTAEYQDRMLSVRRDMSVSKILRLTEENNRLLITNYRLMESENDIFSGNRHDDYLKMWKSTLFLHENEEESKQIKLEDVYVVPNYHDAENNSREDLDDQIQSFLTHTSTWQALIILGDPGLGKSSLISYICSQSKDPDNPIVINFSKLEEKVMQEEDNGIFAAVLRKLNCKSDDLRNRNLIVDGFDEIKLVTNKENLLYDFLVTCSQIEGLRVIVTSRINYIDEKKFYPINIFKLDFFDKTLINEFCAKYNLKMGTPNHKIICNNDILGIPIILYMVLSLNVDVEQNSDVQDLYEKVFALDGGIYDRFETYKHKGYTKISGRHQISKPEVKAQIHLIAKEIAFKIFLNGYNDISETECFDIIDSIDKERRSDFAIGNYYAISNGYLSFTHRSILEYFVSVYIFDALDQAVLVGPDAVAALLSSCFGEQMSQQIVSFLACKMKKMDADRKITFYNGIETAVYLMIMNGMTFFCKSDYRYINTLQDEAFAFSELSKFTHIINVEAEQAPIIPMEYNSYYAYLSNSNAYSYPIYLSYDALQVEKIEYAKLSNLRLYNINLKNVRINTTYVDECVVVNGNLQVFILCNSVLNSASLTCVCGENVICEHTRIESASFFDASFKYAKFEDVAFTDAIFYNVSFDNATLYNVWLDGLDLRRVSFENAKLINVSLKNTDCRGTNMYGVELENVDLRDANFLNTIIDEATYNYLSNYKLAPRNLEEAMIKK